MKKVLIVNSSSRKNSNSSALGKHVGKGAKAAGHAVTLVDISRMHIAPCRGCEACLSPKAESCVQKDDMQQLYPLVKEADVIIYVSPIYWFTLGGQIKQFIDRCYAVAVPKEHVGESPFAGKKLGGVFAYGGDDAFDSGCGNAIRALQDTCFFTGATWAGAVHGAAHHAGVFAKDKELLRKAKEFGASL